MPVHLKRNDESADKEEEEEGEEEEEEEGECRY